MFGIEMNGECKKEVELRNGVEWEEDEMSKGKKKIKIVEEIKKENEIEIIGNIERKSGRKV